MTLRDVTPSGMEVGAFSTVAIVSVQVGRVAPLGPEAVPSGFVKMPVEGRVDVGTLGLAGDQQADLTVHGGSEKAVYGYAHAHYEVWRAEFPEHAALLVPGGLGENLTLSGLDESTAYLGDIVRAGDAMLQITQPRQPCFKFMLRFADPRMPKAMLKSGRSGWYYRVLAPGTVAAGDRVQLLERPNPRWPVARLNGLSVTKAMTLEHLTELAEMPGLASAWRATARLGLRKRAKEVAYRLVEEL